LKPLSPAGGESMVKRAFQVDATVSVRCAVLAEDENKDEAKQKVEQELRRLLTSAPVSGFYIDIRLVDIKSAEVK
jgi:hypothetical protein